MVNHTRLTSPATFLLMTILLAGCGPSPPPASVTQDEVPQSVAESTPPTSRNRGEPLVLSDRDYVTYKRNRIFSLVSQQANGDRPRRPLPRFSFVDVTAVISGDTIEVETEHKELVRVKLTGIDSPELDQPFGEQARRFVDSRIAGKHLPIICNGSDESGVPTVNVLLRPGFLNLQLVTVGLAWYSRTGEEHQWMDPYESTARSRQMGLWGADQDPVPPWEWRQRQAAADPLDDETPVRAADVSQD